MNKIIKKNFQLFEKYFFKLRHLIFFGIIINLFLSIYLIIFTFKEFFYLTSKLFTIKVHTLLIYSLGILDLILLSIIFFIFTFSLYGIFINEFTDKKNLSKIPKAFIVNNLESLKEKLGKVIVLILIITFLKFTLDYTFENMLELLFLAISIFFISISLYFLKEKK